MVLRDRPRRFNEIKRSVDGISQRMLTRTLRGLERDGMISRTIFPTTPPQVEYALTMLGRSLSGPVLALGHRAQDNMAAIDIARAAFDARVVSRQSSFRELSNHACRRSRFTSGAMTACVFEGDGEIARVDPSGPLIVRIGAATALAVDEIVITYAADTIPQNDSDRVRIVRP